MNDETKFFSDNLENQKSEDAKNSDINDTNLNPKDQSNDNHKVIINRNELLPAARELLNKNAVKSPSTECKFKLSGKNAREKMHKILEALYNDKKILDHGMEVGKELAYVLSGGDTDISKELTEDQMYKLELNSFMKLVENKKTQERIVHTLKTGKPLIN